jgi:hypothetical protein
VDFVGVQVHTLLTALREIGGAHGITVPQGAGFVAVARLVTTAAVSIVGLNIDASAIAQLARAAGTGAFLAYLPLPARLAAAAAMR